MKSTVKHSVAFLAVAACATVAQAQSLSIVTTPAGTFSHSAASAMAKLMTEKAKLRTVVQAQASSGFEEVETAQADFTVSNSFDATFYATGTGDYEGRGAKDTIRMIATMVPYRVGMHVKADSPFKSIADLKGRRINSEFNAQKTIGRIVAAHLANGGLSYKDVQGVPSPNVFRAAEDFKSGRVDALFFALGSAAVKEAAVALGGVRVLPVNASADAMKRAQAQLPGSYPLLVNPDPTTDGLTTPTNLIAFDMVMVSNSKLSDDAAYRTVKIIYENKADLAATFPPLGIFNPQNMAKVNQGVPFHPGALRFYKEAGLIK
jgi:uncharacterized protein